MQTCERDFLTALAVPVGVPVLAPAKIEFIEACEVPSCLQIFIDATLQAGRTLTITLVLGTQNGDLYTVTASQTIDITATGKSVISVGVPGGPRVITFNFSSTGPAGADDIVSAKISGLPVQATYVIV